MINIIGDVGRWKCVYRECGAKCCVPPKVTLGDVKRISEILAVEPEEFIIAPGKGGLFEVVEKGGKCFFLNEDSTCRLHKIGVVPLSCQMFPFLFDGIEYGDDIILTVSTATDCPGYGCGESLGEEFYGSLEKLGARFIDEVKECLRYSKQGYSFRECLDKI